MDYYVKGKNVEQEEFVPDDLIANLPPNFTWMKVKPGSKLRNLIPTSIGAFNESGLVLFSGSGPAVTKVVSIAEIVKRRFKNLFQTTRILYRQVDEFWDPKSPDLEVLKVSRQIPMIVVVLSREPLHGSSQQTKNSLETFLNVVSTSNQQQQHRTSKSFGHRRKSQTETFRSKKNQDGKETKKVNKQPSPKESKKSDLSAQNSPVEHCDTKDS